MLYFVCHEPVTKAHSRIRSKVPKREHMRRTDKLTEQMQRSISVDFFNSIKSFKKRISQKKLAEAWEAGKYEDLERTIPWDKMHDDMDPIGETLKSGMNKVPAGAMLALPHRAQKELRWDTHNPRIRSYADHRVGTLIKNIDLESKDAIRQIVSRGFSKVVSPREAAKEIVDHIGLLPRQRQALRNYTAELQKRGHTPQNLQKLGSDYHDRLLMSRAKTIARTESRRLTNYGQNIVFQEAANQDLIDRNTARRVWVVDGMPCEICEPMDGEETSLDDPWEVDTPQGTVTVDVPSDIHPNCECIFTLEVD